MQLLRRFVPDEAEDSFNQGLRYRNRKNREFDFSLALERFKEAIKLNPGVGKYHSELGRAYVAAPLFAVTRDIGGDLVLGESIKLAIDELTQALKLDPNRTETYLILGEAHMYLGNKQKAIEAFQSAINISSFSFSFLSPFSFVDGWLLKSYAKRQIKRLERGTDKPPQFDAAQECIRRAILYRDDSKYQLADKEMMEAFNLAPDWAWVYKTICKLAG